VIVADARLLVDALNSASSRTISGMCGRQGDAASSLEQMPRILHVTSSLNRDSIGNSGLDWSLMGAAPGIAGSVNPEVEGSFVCVDGELDAEWFIQMNNTGGPVDVWEIHGVGSDELIEAANGFMYLPRKVPPEDVTLVRRDA
jgi:hypothetical protein